MLLHVYTPFSRRVVRFGVFECDRCHIVYEKYVNDSKLRLLLTRENFCSCHCNNQRPLTEECKRKLSERMLGSRNPFFGKRHCPELRNIIVQSYKATWASLTDDERETRRQKNSARRAGPKSPMYGRRHSELARKRMSATRSRLISEGVVSSNNRGRSGQYLSSKTNVLEKYDSCYELARMKLLDIDDNVLTWTKKHGIMIPYTLDGVSHNYIPDFLISYVSTMTIEEVKGYEDQSKLSAKIEAATQYCQQMKYQYRLMMFDELESLLKHQLGYNMRALLKETK